MSIYLELLQLLANSRNPVFIAQPSFEKGG